MSGEPMKMDFITDNMIVEKQFYDMITNLERELIEIQAKYERQLAAISVLSLCNTHESLKKLVITKESPAWSGAYDDVKAALRREIHYRDEALRLSEILKNLLGVDVTVSPVYHIPNE